MSRPTHDQFVAKALAHPEVNAEYQRLMVEYKVISELIRARKQAKKTQHDVAVFMETTASAISRIESGTGIRKKYHSPSLATLRKYADAIGYTLEFKLRPVKAVHSCIQK